MKELILKICFVIIFLYAIALSYYEIRLKQAVKKLEREFRELKHFNCIPDSVKFTKEPILEVQIMQLHKKAEQLRFCYQCPLYQDMKKNRRIEK